MSNVVPTPNAEPKARPLAAADLLKSDHPLHQSFLDFIQGLPVAATKRQARKFLAAHPQYRTAQTS